MRSLLNFFYCHFRNEIPVVYAGELKDEQEMLEWLVKMIFD